MHLVLLGARLDLAARAAVCAQVSIPLGFTPAPVTGQTFAVLHVGASLGSSRVPRARCCTSWPAHSVPRSTPITVTAGMCSARPVPLLARLRRRAALTGALAARRWERRCSSSRGALLTGNVVTSANRDHALDRAAGAFGGVCVDCDFVLAVMERVAQLREGDRLHVFADGVVANGFEVFAGRLLLQPVDDPG